MPDAESPAEVASRRALEAMYVCLQAGESFRLEAGAGAGKTYSLIKALRFLIERNQRILPRRSQQIACITFTNVVIGVGAATSFTLNGTLSYPSNVDPSNRAACG